MDGVNVESFSGYKARVSKWQFKQNLDPFLVYLWRGKGFLPKLQNLLRASLL